MHSALMRQQTSPPVPAVGDDFLTTEEVARLCRTSPSTVRFWRHKGTGPLGFAVGRRVLYSRAEVDRWLRGLAADSVTARRGPAA